MGIRMCTFRKITVFFMFCMVLLRDIKILRFWRVKLLKETFKIEWKL